MWLFSCLDLVVNRKNFTMRYQWIDIAKGIGIFFVVLGHVLRGLVNANIATGDFFTFIDSIIYTFHMPLFMFLSGIFVVSSITKHGGRRFFISKLDTIFYPYVFWMIFQGLFEVVLSKYTNGNVSLLDVFSLWLPRAQFWYLYALFLFMTLFLLVYTFVRNWIFLLFPASILLYSFFGTDDTKVLYFFNRFLVFFMMGSLFGVVLPKLEYLIGNRYYALTFVITAILMQYYYHFVFDMNYSDYALSTLTLSIVSIFAVLAISYAISQSAYGVFVSTIGEASILIYLGHILTASGIRVITSKFLGLDDVYLQILFGLIFGILPWFILYRLSLRFDILKSLYQTTLFNRLGNR